AGCGRSAAWAAGPVGWAGRNSTARIAPAAATRPATRQPTDRPCTNALVVAAWITWPAAAFPAAGTWPGTTRAAPADAWAIAGARPGRAAGRRAVSREL